jgi:hypothetical protein
MSHVRSTLGRWLKHYLYGLFAKSWNGAIASVYGFIGVATGSALDPQAIQVPNWKMGAYIFAASFARPQRAGSGETRAESLHLCLLCALCVPTLAGCVVVKTRDTAGNQFTYIAPAFGVKGIDYANIKTGELRGYKSEQSQMAEAIATGIAAGLKPKP